METDWMTEVQAKLQRKNQILFSRQSACLQPLLAQIRLQSHRTLVLWAFACVKQPLARLKEHMPQELRPAKAVELCQLWAMGKVKMPVAKQALLQAHQVAKEIESPEDIALCHAVGQACAAVHVETHAIGLAIYELTAIVRRFGLKECRTPVEDRIAEYSFVLTQCQQAAEDKRLQWAPFLLLDRANKEQQLQQKQKERQNNIS